MRPVSVAIDAAHAAGEHILRHFGQALEIQTKGPDDYVTQVDVAAEAMIVRTIRSAYPHDAFWGEETHVPGTDAQRVWVIDPLDGTRNYTVGLPFFCISIALWVADRPVLGVVYDPLRAETFHAVAGEGSYLNGARIRFVPKHRLDGAIVYIGFLPAQNPDDPGLSLPIYGRLRPSVAAMRNIGSAALSLAYIASGRIDIACHDRLQAWDMLAGALLIEESGGVATDFQGYPLTLSSRDIIAASSEALHAAVLRVAQSVTGEPGATAH